MTTNIIIAPDIYYRNWDAPNKGEVWMVLRPMIDVGKITSQYPLGDNLEEFLKWAENPHRSVSSTGEELYKFSSPREWRCDDYQISKNILPVNLPSDIDVEIQFGFLNGKTKTIVINRTSQCRVLLPNVGAVAKSNDKITTLIPLNTAGLGKAIPFSEAFNQNISRNIAHIRAKYPSNPFKQQQAINEAIFLFASQMEQGLQLPFSAGDNVIEEPYWYDKKGAKVKLAIPEITYPEFPSKKLASAYWHLGLMFKLGDRSNIQSLKTIDRLDITLKSRKAKQVKGGNGSNYTSLEYGNEQEKPTYSHLNHLCFPDALAGQERLDQYFKAIDVEFARSLVCTVEDRENLLYVSPGFRTAQLHGAPLDMKIGNKSLKMSRWVIERASPEVNLGDQSSKKSKKLIDGDVSKTLATLNHLAALEIRGALQEITEKDGVHNDLSDQDSTNDGVLEALRVIPGLLVTGTLKPYRRFPMIKASKKGEPFRATVLQFEPDPTMADSVFQLLDVIETSDVLKQPYNGWVFSLLHSGQFPWDGPKKVIKLLAEPQKQKSEKPGDDLMCTLAQFEFFISPMKSGDYLKAKSVSKQSGSSIKRHIWNPNVVDVARLNDQWSHRFDASITEKWSKIIFNAFEVYGLEQPKEATLNIMMANEFNFHAAESPVRLEKILTCEAKSPRLDQNKIRPIDPLRDFEDDLVNFNSAILSYSSNLPARRSVLGERTLRIPMRTEFEQNLRCITDGLVREQNIPLLEGWPSDPLNIPEKDWKDDISWSDIRGITTQCYDLVQMSTAGPFFVDLQHTYGDREPAKSNKETIVKLSRSERRDWPVASLARAQSSVVLKPANSAENQDLPITENRRFLECSFEHKEGQRSPTIFLTFDTSFLYFEDLKKEAFQESKKGTTLNDEQNKEQIQKYSNALLAWRSLAEIATEGAEISLEIERVGFSLDKLEELAVLPDLVAEYVAKNGVINGWASAIKYLEPLRLNDGFQDIIKWAKDSLKRGGASHES